MAMPARRAEVRTALRRMSAITVFVAALALTSPPAAAPTDREPPVPVAPTAIALDTDPLLGPWAVERFFTPYPTVYDLPVPQDETGGTALTPAAVLPTAGIQAAVSTLWELLRYASTAVRISVPWLQRISWPDETIHQQPLPAPALADDLPVFAPHGFDDILDYGGVGPLRSGLHLPVATTGRSRDNPRDFADVGRQRSPESCF